MVEIKIKDGVKGIPDDIHMPQLAPKALEAEYRGWRQTMLHLVYGNQERKTWNTKSVQDRWRVGQP